MAEEMAKTVETLNEFIKKVKMANTVQEKNRILVANKSNLLRPKP